MAGMLPGVEYARRRRFHQSSCSADPPTSSSRRSSSSSSFCSHRTGHEPHLSSSSMQTITFHKAIRNQALGEIAREAKERLDARLGARRQNSLGSVKLKERETDGEEGVGLGSLQREVFMASRKKKKNQQQQQQQQQQKDKFSWSKMMGWKASEQAECAVCLEEFETGDVLIHLPCAHRFHWSCVVPWLESSSCCPCCRTTVPFKTGGQ